MNCVHQLFVWSMIQHQKLCLILEIQGATWPSLKFLKMAGNGLQPLSATVLLIMWRYFWWQSRRSRTDNECFSRGKVSNILLKRGLWAYISSWLTHLYREIESQLYFWCWLSIIGSNKDCDLVLSIYIHQHVNHNDKQGRYANFNYKYKYNIILACIH